MQHLDGITSGMALPEGHFYELYIDEYIAGATADWRRLRPFLARCAELGKLDCITKVTNEIMDNLSYTPMLFDLAEQWYGEDNKAAAMVLYQRVAESEKMQHSERLALCHYRMFTISLGDDLEANLRAAILFEGYVSYLDELDQLDALLKLAYTYDALRRWNKVDELAQKLYKVSIMEYKLQRSSDRTVNFIKQPERPLCSYPLYALLLRSVACEENEDYEGALHYVHLYSNPDWIQEDTEESRRVLGQFKEWAIANTMLYRLLSGDFEIIPEYLNYISAFEDEIPTAIFNVVKAANRYNFNVDFFLERFSSHISIRRYLNKIAEYNQQIMDEQYTCLLAELAKYHLSYNRNTGIQYILQALNFSLKIKSEKNIIKCLVLFERYRSKATHLEKLEFNNLANEVYV
ncbi:transcriptional regulator [Paenibacillus massiliensis]|uniref:transcriptional regulator n=1 Tax=Paenibacillus massiliensis TaxID=225917 RepID=UPI001E3C71C0|nr:transcriptional regulator [Paenibacillus massiliensis]